MNGGRSLFPAHGARHSGAYGRSHHESHALWAGASHRECGGRDDRAQAAERRGGQERWRGDDRRCRRARSRLRSGRLADGLGAPTPASPASNCSGDSANDAFFVYSLPRLGVGKAGRHHVQPADGSGRGLRQVRVPADRQARVAVHLGNTERDTGQVLQGTQFTFSRLRAVGAAGGELATGLRFTDLAAGRLQRRGRVLGRRGEGGRQVLEHAAHIRQERTATQRTELAGCGRRGGYRPVARRVASRYRCGDRRAHRRCRGRTATTKESWKGV